ncbi:MAG: ABC transporter substrate-binding protein [Treponema sp.]|jgi:ABC-type amino acid transport substrate-binding protein|nr:ABC transporter substrate-binding protein [Treponema sp.]
MSTGFFKKRAVRERWRGVTRWWLPLFAVLAVSCGREKGAGTVSPPEELSPLETVRSLEAANSRLDVSLADTRAYPREIRSILSRGSVIFAMTAADQKPFFYQEETTGELIGLDVEIAYEIANRLGVRAVFNRDAASFDGVVTKVVNKEADIALSKLSRTMRRAELVRYTKPYIVFRQALLVNRLEFAKIGPEDQLPGYIKNFQGSLGVIKNSSYENYAAVNFPAAAIEAFDTWGETVDALFAGKVLAVYRDEGEILIVNAIRKDAAMLMKTVFINDQQDPIAMAVNADAPFLQEWLNVFLEEYLPQKPEEFITARIVRRHFGAGAP